MRPLRGSLYIAIFFLLSCSFLRTPAAYAQIWTQTAGPFGAVSLLASGGSTLYAGEEGGTIVE